MAKIRSAENGTTRDVIIAVAASLFQEKGYASSSMRELAEKLGVEAPSLYNHIGSKSELLHQVCMQVANMFTLQMQEVVTNPGSTLDKLEVLIRFHIHMMVAHYNEVYTSNHDWRYLKEPYMGIFLAQRKSYENKFVAIISEGINAAELKDLNPHVLVLTILSAVRGLEFWQRHKKEIPSTILEDTMVNHLLYGLTK